MLAFGGPASREEVRPFLAEVLRGRPMPPGRIEEVVRHYEAIGGASPLVAITRRLAHALEGELAARGIPLRVEVGMRSGRPRILEALRALAAAGTRRVRAVVLAPHRTEASWDRYLDAVAEARSALGESAPEVDYVPAWHTAALFVEAVALRAEAALAPVPAAERDAVPMVFTAHSVPVAMATASGYAEQVCESARLVAGRLGRSDWRVAYQSRSGSPREPWLGPDVESVLAELAKRRYRRPDTVLVVPIGFVCDHVEVLYDLDIQARDAAARVGLRMLRAQTLNDDPLFVRLLAELVQAGSM